MIRYVYDPQARDDLFGGEGAYAPRVICDACLEPITDYGNAYWLVRPDGEIHPQVWHTHKWPCSELDRGITERHGGTVMFEELDRWLRQVRHNFEPTVATKAQQAQKGGAP